MTHAHPAATTEITPPPADMPLVDPATVPERRRELVPRYGDPVWSFLAISQNPSSADDVIRWARFPDALRDQFRHAAWMLARVPLSAADLARHGPAMRARLSPGRIYRTVRDWRVFAEWIHARGHTALASVTTDDLIDYSRHLSDHVHLARNTVIGHLVALTRLSSYTNTYLPAEHRLVEPPWLSEGMDDYLPAATPLGENITEPISPATIGPLLTWALRFVELFSADILAARTERNRVIASAEQATENRSAGDSAWAAYLLAMETRTTPVPTTTNNGSPRLAVTYLAGLTGTSTTKVHATFSNPRWRKILADNPGPATLRTPITAVVDGQPWTPPLQFGEVPVLVRHLGTACFIVIAYLTGMRPGEVLGLQTGCCPHADEPADAPRRHVIHGRQFKHARDEHGNHLSAGQVRDAPWVAIPQVVTAIRVLETFVGDGLLFDAVTHDRRQPKRRTDRSIATTTMANRVEAFITWVNEFATTQGRHNELIRPDPEGRVGIARFRRTLAWHIARQPGGLVALAIQYGHMRTLISEGYASRSRGGIHDLLDIETARTVAEHLSDLHEALHDGEGLSGPAARRLINATTEQHHRFGGMITTARQAKNLLADPTLAVFENKQAYLICNYDRARALCHPGRGTKTTAPSLDRCVATCTNIARTDRHAHQLAAHAQRLVIQADSQATPQPIADRLREKAHQMNQLARRHDNNRITLAEDPR